MPNSIEDLHKKLEEQIEALAEQRRQESLRVEKQISEINTAAQAERQRQIEEYEKKQEEHRARRQKELEQVEKERKEVEQKRFEAEQAANAAAEAKQKQIEKLEWLQNEISKLEFMEEQHKKDLDDKKAIAETNAKQLYVVHEINVENPAAPDNKGEAVKGTEGATPDNPSMSAHLKHILRQAVRSY